VKVKQKDWVQHGDREKQKRIGGEDAAKEFNGTSPQLRRGPD